MAGDCVVAVAAAAVGEDNGDGDGDTGLTAPPVVVDAAPAGEVVAAVAVVVVGARLALVLFNAASTSVMLDAPLQTYNVASSRVIPAVIKFCTDRSCTKVNGLEVVVGRRATRSGDLCSTTSSLETDTRGISEKLINRLPGVVPVPLVAVDGNVLLDVVGDKLCRLRFFLMIIEACSRLYPRCKRAWYSGSSSTGASSRDGDDGTPVVAGAVAVADGVAVVEVNTGATGA